MHKTKLLLFFVFLIINNCSKPHQGQVPKAPLSAPCPLEAPAPPTLPFERPIHRVASFWLQKMSNSNIEKPLLTTEQIEVFNQQVSNLTKGSWPIGRWNLINRLVDHTAIWQQWMLQIKNLQKKIELGIRVNADGTPAFSFPKSFSDKLKSISMSDEIRVVYKNAPLRCYPTKQGLYESAWETAFDLAQCSQLRTGEIVRVLGKTKDWWYVWTSYAEGWIIPTHLTPPLQKEDSQSFLQPEKFIVALADNIPIWSNTTNNRLIIGVLSLGGRLPLIRTHLKNFLQVVVPTPLGLGTGWISNDLQISVGYPPFSREVFFNIAFSQLNTPYSWGGINGYRDCSSFLMDLFGVFGLELPRNSLRQSKIPWHNINVTNLSETEKLKQIEDAAQKGIVILYLPGHVMLYVGRDADHYYALHQSSGYKEPCPKGGETTKRLNRTAVTSLALGKGSSRKSFIERITRLIVISPEM